MLRAYAKGTLWKSKGVGSYMCPTLALCAGEGHTPSIERDRGAVKMRSDRSKWEIILDILEVIRAEEKAKKTRIMYMAYLDWRNFTRHFNFLLEEGHIMKCNPDNECYKLTENGDNLLKKLKEVHEILC
jgi:predicted transcriptional regulator